MVDINGNINGRKPLHRFDPFVIATAVLGIVFVLAFVIYLSFPIITLRYTENGVNVQVGVTGFDFFKAFAERMNTKAHTELGDAFFTFLRNQRGATLNSFDSFLINGANGRMEQVTVCTILFELSTIICVSVAEVIVCVLGLIFGRLHAPRSVKALTGVSFGFFISYMIELFTFYYLYNNLPQSIAAYDGNQVTYASVLPLYSSFVFLGILFAINIAITVIYQAGLKGRVFRKRDAI